MIDNYDEAMDLMRKMERELPIPALATKEFIQAMRKNGVRITRIQEIQIEKVLYMGDEGGIGCAVRIPRQEATAVVTSLTHIRVNYIIHTILLNHFLAKNAPEMTKPGRSKENRKERGIRIEAITDDDAPRWVILVGFPSLPLFFFGILIVIIAFVFRLLR